MVHGQGFFFVEVAADGAASVLGRKRLFVLLDRDAKLSPQVGGALPFGVRSGICLPPPLVVRSLAGSARRSAPFTLPAKLSNVLLDATPGALPKCLHGVSVFPWRVNTPSPLRTNLGARKGVDQSPPAGPRGRVGVHRIRVEHHHSGSWREVVPSSAGSDHSGPVLAVM